MMNSSIPSRQDGSYPRPQLVRRRHAVLGKDALFTFDDLDEGRNAHWEADARPFARQIRLPFSPESEASGIGDTDFHRVAWYWIPLTAENLDQAGYGDQGTTLRLHFGAVEYLSDIWVDGSHVATHRGGQTPFSVDITTALNSDVAQHWVVVRAENDPLDMATPRGKQDWNREPHGIWYHRITGIWRTVWLEAVPTISVEQVQWASDPATRRIDCSVQLTAAPQIPMSIAIRLSLNGKHFASSSVEVSSSRIDVSLSFEANQMELSDILWTPETPVLIDAAIETLPSDGSSGDRIGSYFGIRTVSTDRGHFRLNHRPYFLRAVLEQGYWKDSHYTPPSSEALKAEVQLIQDLGFNAVRIHQKTEDPRFVYWADRSGLVVWVEAAAAYEFSPTAVRRFTDDWIRIVETYKSHPSVAVWVPFNESWGIAEVSRDPRQQAFSRGISELTRSLDGSRPVISNDGWEHIESDLVTIHDYESSGRVLTTRYSKSRNDLLDEEPQGRALTITAGQHSSLPFILSEFGGVAYGGSHDAEGWGYSTAETSVSFEASLREIFGAVGASESLVGFCYTQLTDTGLEINGLCWADRTPKLSTDTIAAIVRGDDAPRTNVAIPIDNENIDDAREIRVSV
jgi:beta-galactosidase/beta-glucuronidase